MIQLRAFAFFAVTAGYAGALVACAADAGPDLKTTDDGGPLDTGPLVEDSTAPAETGLDPDTGTPADSDMPVDSTTPTDTSVVDTGMVAMDTGMVAMDTGMVAMDTGMVVMDTGTVMIDAGSCPTCPLTLKYRAANTMATSSEMKPIFEIINNGSTPQPLSEIKIRYWFTINEEKTMVGECDYAFVNCSNITRTFVKMPAAKATADYYFEETFSAGAGNIAPGGTSGEIQNRLHKADYSTFSQSDDYSFDPTKTAFTAWDHVTVYRAGVLVYGTEP